MNIKAIELKGYLGAWADMNEARSDTSCDFQLVPLRSSHFAWLHHCVTAQLNVPKGLLLKESGEPEKLLASVLMDWCFSGIPVLDNSHATLSMHLTEGRNWRVGNMLNQFREAFGSFRLIEIEITESLPDPKTGRIPFVACSWNEYVLVAEDLSQWYLYFGVSD